MNMIAESLDRVEMTASDLADYLEMLACNPEAEHHHQDDESPLECLEADEPADYDAWPDWAQEVRWETTDEADRLESAWEDAAASDAFWARLEDLGYGRPSGLTDEDIATVGAVG